MFTINNDVFYIGIPCLVKWLGNHKLCPAMLQPAQIRAARALLGWRQGDLAKAADIGVATVQRIELLEGPAGNVATLLRIQQAFEKAGILFLDADREAGIGVRLKKPKMR